jgi:hypothetical protein
VARSIAWVMCLAVAGCSDGGAGSDAAVTADGSGSSTTDATATVDAAPSSFSFFVTSLATMRLQSGSQDGFGGNLGGLAGADAICQRAASDVGAGEKTWRAFLSTSDGTNAIDRVGTGPWYDRNGRLVAQNVQGLLQTRPAGDAQTKNDLPDENGVPLTTFGDSHDIMTGSTSQGRAQSANPMDTCMDWTSSSTSTTFSERTYLGHSWPAGSGQGWIQAHRMRGCAPGVNLQQNGPGMGTCVGCGGGWGAIYCFAVTP